MKTKIKSAIRAARHSFSGVVCVGAVMLLSSSAQAQNPEILANNVGNPDNIIIDESSVYWDDQYTGIISSVSKNPGGAVTNYAVAMVPGGDLAQDNASLYFGGAANEGMFVGEHFVYKTPKFGGFANRIDNDFGYGGTLTIGPAGGILYYIGGARSIPGDNSNLWRPIVALSTQGGSDNPLIYSNPEGIEETLFQQDGLRYYLGDLPGHFSTDSTFLYWSDSDSTSIWQMPLIGGSATAIVSGRTNIHVIATPTTGAAAGSIFWVEGNIGSASLMRREVGGQIITVLTGINNATNRCFAVDDDKVFCEKGDGLVQVSINGGTAMVLASVDQAFGPVGVAVDSSYVYWSNLVGQILRIVTTGAPTPTPTPTPTPRPATLGNISTRLQVGTADRVMIAGFIVQGSAPKRVLIRAAGPSLTQFGVPNPLANPRLELHDTNNTIGMNDDWQTTQIGGVITSDQVAEIQNSGLAPRDPLESALIATLAPGSYTAIVQGVNSGTGVGIVEAYDLDATSGSLLANISTRGFVQTGDNAMIGGFIVVVAQPTRVIIRAIGPSLTQFGVPDALANPQLELHDATSLIGMNDDWQTTQIFGIITSDQVAEIQNSQLAPTNPAESAIIATLQPGSYTAIVRGVSSTTGNALVEVYSLQ